ncbi:hypothetical protein [Candidatus Enterococcus lemimoniae]|uniref:hypothetical protein n=1 Tax=Candidatus Enterococcus lemimoniae TaxID=1834167 RepID=UPI001593CC3D|nr:hypothetical protein [Enterococcus sp. 12C11_DIV0727]
MSSQIRFYELELAAVADTAIAAAAALASCAFIIVSVNAVIFKLVSLDKSVISAWIKSPKAKEWQKSLYQRKLVFSSSSSE